MKEASAADLIGQAQKWWSTAIVDAKPGVIRLRGYPIEQLIGGVSFAQMIWLMLRGELPSAEQAALLEAALVSAVDHGPQAPSIAIGRMAVTCGLPLNGAMASFHNRMVQQLVAHVREQHGRTISMVGGSDAHTLKHVAKVHTVSRGETPAEFLANVRAGQCFGWGSEMRFSELITDIYTLILAYHGETRADLLSDEYTATQKAIQLAGRIASVPTAISGLPAAITSLNYLKQIVVTKGISLRFAKLVDEIRPGLR